MTRTARIMGLAGAALGAALGLAFAADPALAQQASAEGQEAVAVAAATPQGVSPEVAYILNTFLFLVAGFLVMWMAAGFAMLEAGLVRKRSVGVQLLKNVGLYSIAGLMYWLVGYNLMYADVDGGFMGTLGLWSHDGEVDVAGGYSGSSDWFFQMVFVATAASIVSGTLAERIKVWPFFLFVALLTGISYPITGAWQWGGGFLSEAGFSDFAGSTLVHSVGGWAALAGAILLGPRLGKYGSGGRVNPMPASSLPLATLGTLILWLGWFGFNGGSQLALGTPEDANAVARIFVNTNLAAAAGVVIAIALTEVVYKKIDLTMALNGAIAGLVAITAEPLTPSPFAAVVIGAIGGAIVVFAVPLLDKLKIDDVVGAIPVHLFAGVWGTLAVPFTNPDTGFATQLYGVVAIGAFTLAFSFVVWAVIKFTVGIRISEADEEAGIDQRELGMEAYPEFGPSHAV